MRVVKRGNPSAHTVTRQVSAKPTLEIRQNEVNRNLRQARQELEARKTGRGLSSLPQQDTLKQALLEPHGEHIHLHSPWL
jgi:hypothetical protein